MSMVQMLVIDGGLLALGVTFKLQQVGLLAGEQRLIRQARRTPRPSGEVQLLAPATKPAST